MNTVDFVTTLLASGVRLSVPVAIAATGEVVAERSGIVNVGVEGVMLMGAFISVYGSAVSGSPWIGFFCAIACGAVLGAAHAFFAIRLRAEQIVTGIAMVILCLGLSGLLFRLTIGGKPFAIDGFDPLDIYPLSAIPVVGPAFFQQTILTYLGLAIVVLTGWMLRATRFGLEIRAAGESPATVEAAGISVANRRFVATVYGGALAGFGGAALAITGLNNFIENMVAGQGFIAIACVVFGRWRPLGAVIAAFGFGLAEALQIRLQMLVPDLPYQLLVILPYFAAVIALVLLGRSVQSPKALGQPFRSAQ
jgi:general nucleoside transport system permease protein